MTTRNIDIELLKKDLASIQKGISNIEKELAEIKGEKVSIALIVKDEAKILDKCLSSVKEADEIREIRNKLFNKIKSYKNPIIKTINWKNGWGITRFVKI